MSVMSNFRGRDFINYARRLTTEQPEHRLVDMEQYRAVCPLEHWHDGCCQRDADSGGCTASRSVVRIGRFGTSRSLKIDKKPMRRKAVSSNKLMTLAYSWDFIVLVGYVVYLHSVNGGLFLW